MNTFSLKIILFYCSNSISQDELNKTINKGVGIEIRMISLPCSGKLDLLYLLKAIETGTDGIILITCPEGNCQNLEGNLRAKKRVHAVNSILEEAGSGKERILFFPVSEDTESDFVFKEIIKFCNNIKGMPRQKKVLAQ